RRRDEQHQRVRRRAQSSEHRVSNEHRVGGYADAMSQRRVVVVTGGSAGVGRAVVREFAANGYDVAILARGAAGLAAAAADAERCGGRALPIQTDVAVLAQAEAAAARVEAELGSIDVWVNVAFVGALRF